MDGNYQTLSGYRIMWIWAMFDLPVYSKKERSAASKFRLSLLDMGFEMVQFSVYARYANSKEKADWFADQVGDLVPSYGKVDVLFFTDKQYGLIQSYRGPNDIELLEKPTQYTLF